MERSDSLKAVFYALGANAAIAVAKYVAAAFTGSSAMLAEAVHSTVDCSNQALLLLGHKRAKRAATAEYPMGFGKEIYFWSFVVAILLFSLGGLFSFYEGLHKLRSPEAVSHPVIAIGVLVFSLAAEATSMYGCIREVNKVRGELTLWQWFRASRNADLVVIFGEDLAALVGLTFALAAVAASWATGDPAYDAWGTIAIGVLLVVIAWLVAIEVKALLVGQGVEPRVRAEMVAFLEREGAVEKVLELLTLHFGNDVMVAVKAKMREHESQRALIDAINAIEAAFKQRFPQTRWTFFEPDIRK